MSEATSGTYLAVRNPACRGACHRAGHFGPDPLAHAGYLSPRLQLSRFSQIRVDPRLPTRTGLAIGREHIRVEAELHGLLRIWQRRPAAADNSVALSDFSPVKKRIR